MRASAKSVAASRSSGILLGDLAHRVGVGLVARAAILGLARVALRHRVDVRLLAGRRLRLQRHGLLRQLVGLRLVFGGHGHVDVRAEDEGLAPVGHRAARVEARRLAEGPAGLGVVEAVGEVHALVDEGLGLLRPGRDREGVRARGSAAGAPARRWHSASGSPASSRSACARAPGRAPTRVRG